MSCRVECFDYDLTDDVTEAPDYSDMVFYHGTSSALKLTHLYPAALTGVLREGWRVDKTDRVFFTNSVWSAYKYAVKACRRFGGEPIIYIVRPIGDIFYVHTNEFTAYEADIIGIYEKGNESGHEARTVLILWSNYSVQL